MLIIIEYVKQIKNDKIKPHFAILAFRLVIPVYASNGACIFYFSHLYQLNIVTFKISQPGECEVTFHINFLFCNNTSFIFIGLFICSSIVCSCPLSIFQLHCGSSSYILLCILLKY